MSEPARSEQACPVCAQHTLALDRPPEIDVMGVQQYNDLLGLGDLENEGALGIICLNCMARWRDKAAFDRGEPEPDIDAEATPAADASAVSGGADDRE